MLSKIISEERLGTYLSASGHNEERALALYGWNIRISEAFFPVLCAAEVSLRNIISSRLRVSYGDTWWREEGFLAEIKKGKGIVKRAEDSLNQRGHVTSGGITAELNFGFWVKMLLPKHEAVFWGDLRQAFEHLPAQVRYEDLYQRCDSIREFRNRIFHHEPIFNRDISKEYSEIMEFIEWLSPEKAVWIKKLSRIMIVMRQKP